MPLYSPQPGAEYPDGGSTVECFTVGRGEIPGLNYNYEGSGIHLMETEVLSPMYDFAPGGSHTITIEWGICRCPGMVVDVAEAGCAARKLGVAQNGDYMHVTGAFGVFDAGSLFLQALDAAGKIVVERMLGVVDPLTAVAVDTLIPGIMPDSVRLVVVANVDRQTRTLAEAIR